MARHRSSPRSLAHPRYWLTWIGIGLLRASACLPQPARLALGRSLGYLLYRLARARRHITEVNIDHCFPELDRNARQALVRETLQDNAIGLLETALAWWASDATLRQMAHFEGTEHLEAAAAQGRGVLMLGAHFTTLDIGGRLARLHFDFDVIYRKSKNPVMDRLIRRNREKFFGRVIERSDIRQILRSLKAGHIVWYAPDQDYGRKHSVFAPFFGVPAASITATARLARMNQSPVLFISHYRDDNGHYRVSFSPVLADYPCEDEVVNASRINTAIEQSIRRRPSQYMWVHRRFKTRPEGEAPFYQMKP